MDRKIVIIADRDWIGVSDMREILFKAKRKYNGEWVEGYYAMLGVGDIVRHYIIQNCAVAKLFEKPEDNMYFNDIEIDPDTLCQYTGLTDKNDQKIWENDILKWRFKRVQKEDYHISQVVWNSFYSAFKISVSGGFAKLREDIEYEAIGNIFDNPVGLEVE